ncbi:MAG: hypothetical protein JST44_24050 [Cyanobacteria bacterium SZAS LIN-5]|nr:hypothetical protein [Cyanobacteria bacterium SZAS LIN-5]
MREFEQAPGSPDISDSLIASAKVIFSIDDPDIRRIAATKFGQLNGSRSDLPEILIAGQALSQSSHESATACAGKLSSEHDERLANSLAQVILLEDPNLSASIVTDASNIIAFKSEDPGSTLKRTNQIVNCLRQSRIDRRF